MFYLYDTVISEDFWGGQLEEDFWEGQPKEDFRRDQPEEDFRRDKLDEDFPTSRFRFGPKLASPGQALHRGAARQQELETREIQQNWQILLQGLNWIKKILQNLLPNKKGWLLNLTLLSLYAFQLPLTKNVLSFNQEWEQALLV